MNEVSKGARPLTSVELLDAAVWREIGSEEPQPRAAFVDALAAIVGRWLLVRSDAPDMDLIGTPGRYARNGKRHKKQSASKKAAVVCAWVPGRRCGDVGRVCDRVAG